MAHTAAYCPPFLFLCVCVCVCVTLTDWIKSLFWKEEMELTLVGLQNSGKSTFVDVIAVRMLLSLLHKPKHRCRIRASEPARESVV